MPLKFFYKFKNKLLLVAAAVAANLFFAAAHKAQDIDVKIKILSDSRVRVEGKFTSAKNASANKNFSFLQNYADVTNLGARIENLDLFDGRGAKIAVKKLAAGEFLGNETAASFDFDVRANLPDNPASAAHVSWLAGGQGLLMTNDLLPENSLPFSARVTFEMPSGWKISSSETKIGENIFEVKNIEKAVFLVGKNWRERTAKIGKTEINLAISGEWQFTDDEALQMASAILAEHEKVFGEIPVGKTRIFLLPFPAPENPDRWRAETRGATVTILSGAISQKSVAVQRLHEQLRHEIFHLWIPNGVALTGNYDWFYEGFTIYQALRAGVFTNQIRFEDFLDTLGHAFDSAQNQNRSLVEMSENRWSGANNSVYAKGMIVAFLCDLAMLRASGGKHSVADIFRLVYQKYRAPHAPQDGNAAILGILKSRPELLFIVQNYIEGTAKIDWQKDLQAFGIEVVRNDFGTRLKVVPKPDRREQDLLNELGYNQWRKLLLQTTK